MADRLGINHPHRMPYAAARSAVRELWEHRPETSGREILEVLRRDHIISVGRIYELLRECRGVTARQDPIQKRVGWRIDYRTSARGRIGRIWKRRPEVTARQVIETRSALIRQLFYSAPVFGQWLYLSFIALKWRNPGIDIRLLSSVARIRRKLGWSQDELQAAIKVAAWLLVGAVVVVALVLTLLTDSRSR